MLRCNINNATTAGEDMLTCLKKCCKNLLKIVMASQQMRADNYLRLNGYLR